MWTDLSGEPLCSTSDRESDEAPDVDGWQRFQLGQTPEFRIVLNVKVQLMGFHVQIPRCEFIARVVANRLGQCVSVLVG